MAVCIAVIDKDNSPIFIRTIVDGQLEGELKFHYTVHSSLDIVDEKLSTSQAGARSTDIRELYLGLLVSTEEYKVFGYATNTNIKFIIVIELSNTTIKDQEIRSIFRKLHNVYCDVVSSPFYIPGKKIESQRFLAVVNDTMKKV